MKMRPLYCIVTLTFFLGSVFNAPLSDLFTEMRSFVTTTPDTDLNTNKTTTPDTDLNTNQGTHSPHTDLKASLVTTTPDTDLNTNEMSTPDTDLNTNQGTHSPHTDLEANLVTTTPDTDLNTNEMTTLDTDLNTNQGTYSPHTDLEANLVTTTPDTDLNTNEMTTPDTDLNTNQATTPDTDLNTNQGTLSPHTDLKDNLVTTTPDSDLNTNERTLSPHTDNLVTISDTDLNTNQDVPDVYTTVLRANKDSKKLLLQGDIFYKVGRNALNCSDCLWPKSNSGIVNVPYVLSPDYDVNEVSIITAAMEEFKTLTCVKFIPQTVETDYLDIKQDSGCWSYIGMTHGAQTVSLRKNECIDHGTVQHELNHALGFVHEHCRSDRDDYVTIMKQYISPGNISNFDKQDTNNLGVQYDYSSLMHYPRYAFSNTPGQDTIVPKPDPNVPIGQSYGLSNLDVLKINRLYECDICSSLISSSTGTVTSANYPSVYLNNTNCLWLIRIPANKVFLTFEAFDIQSSTNCMSDYVKVYDGVSKTSPVLLDKTCGSGMLSSFISSSNSMLLEFVSDGAVTATGFKASYTGVYCGATINSAPGVITSPGYPNLYPPSVDCFWIITAPPQKTVLIYFSAFNLETYPYCRYDYVRIYDGKTTSSPLLGTFCSKRSFNIASSGTSMLIKFHSDSTNQYTGFQASYTFF